MAEFDRECGSIQADLARRAGSLLKQYSNLTKDLPEEKRYDATLAVAVLGLLLVNCNEALAIMEEDHYSHLLWPDIQRIVLERANNNFPSPIQAKVEADALAHLRNAISHPLPARRDLCPLTGYTSRPVGTDPKQPVTRFEFFSSPWMSNAGVLPKYRSRRKSVVQSNLGRFAQRYRCDEVLEVREMSEGIFSIVDSQTGAEYIPVFSVTLAPVLQ